MTPEVRRSVCALDCPDACAMLVTIENGRGTRLRGDPRHPVTQGFLCGKVARYLEREYHPDRLLYPQRRTGAKGAGEFTRITWDEALDTIAENLSRIAAQHGPEAVLPYSYAGTMGLLNGSGMDRRFFHRFGASRLDRTICSAAGIAGMVEAYGVRLSTEPEQFRHAKFILGWGANTHGNNIHLWPFIVEARRNGAMFWMIDPVRTRTAALADRHLQIYPGSDTALALGLMHVIFEERLEDAEYLAQHAANVEGLRESARAYTPERTAALTGIDREDIVTLAREYAATQPAVIRLNLGVQRSERGGAAVRAVSYLPVITGAWRRVGGGLQLSTSGAFQVNRAGLEMAELQKRSPLGRDARVINMTEIGKALTDADRAVHALVVYNSNPAAIAPNQSKVLAGLRRDDLFSVVLEQFQNDTADYADILLPVTTFLEHTDLYLSYGHHYLQMARPALPPPGECRSNVEIFRALAERMGFDDECFKHSEDDMIRTALDSPHPYVNGITLEDLEKSWVRLRVAPNGDPFLPFANGGYGTPDGRISCRPVAYTPPVESRLGDAALRERYPLELISSKNDDSMNSTFGHRHEVDAQTSQLWLHAEDAAPRGIADGDQVRVFNDRGSCLMRAHVNGGVRQGVVRAPAVRWTRRSPNGAGINTLTSDRLTDIGGGPVFYSCLVEVTKCGD